MTIRTIKGLVTISDLTGYAKFAAKKPENEIFQLLSDYYELVGDVIAPASGRVIKFMGDGALMLFPEDKVDAGVRALLELQGRGNRFLSERNVPSQHHIRAHFGPVCCGEVGTRNDKRLDVLGSTVNAVFMMKTPGFAITPGTFRKLAPRTRKLFKKHMPPIAYIPLTRLTKRSE